MDIIASHRLGLVEQLEAEALALAGRPRDGGQRALVYHHVADMSGLAHVYALLAAQGALAIDAEVVAMKRQVRRAWWRLSRDERAALIERIGAFAETLGALDAERCAGVLGAYRLVATPGLAREAKERLSPEMFATLKNIRSGRGDADRGARLALFVAHQRWADALVGGRVADAVARLAWPLGERGVKQAVAALLVPANSYDRAERGGRARVEQRLRASRHLPEGFAANPAQAFFRLQRQIAERRRRAVDEDHLSPGDTVSLAA